ncbi:MAG: hypothetical protein AB1705_01475 [Verrucomicrobiota bacterium]
MSISFAKTPYFKRLGISASVVWFSSLLLARGSVRGASEVQWFGVGERLGYYQLLPDHWFFSVTCGVATVLLLLVAARWTAASFIVTFWFVLNELYAFWFASVYDGHS